MRYRLSYSWHLQGRLERVMSVKKNGLFERIEFVVFSERVRVRMVVDL